MRASRILATRPDRAIIALAQLCEERKEANVQTSPPPAIFIPPRLSPIPPQTPYTVGSNSDAKGLPSPERIAPPQPQFLATVARIDVTSRSPPEHMAPKRSEWTSPPPPEAPPADHTSFENQLGLSLELATSSTEAREREEAYASSSSNSEVPSDDEPHSDTEDVRSVRSFTEGSSPSGPSFHRPPWQFMQDSTVHVAPVPRGFNAEVIGGIGPRGRYPSRLADKDHDPRHTMYLGQGHDTIATTCRADASRRSISGPPRASHRLSLPSMLPIALVTPLPPSPSGSESPVKSHSPESSTVFYETGSRHPPVLYSTSPGPGHHSPIVASQQRQHHLGLFSTAFSNLSDHRPPTGISRSSHPTETGSGQSSAGPNTPTPSHYARPAHHHSHSNATITAPTPRANTSQFAQNVHLSSSSPSRSPSPSPPPPEVPPNQHLLASGPGPNSLFTSTSYESDSPTPSSTSCATSVSSSPPSSSSVENFDSQAASPVAEEVTPKLLVPTVQLHASI
jgi:terminal uridylyltransferase